MLPCACACADVAPHDVHRSPDDSKIKQKMLFASSKDALRRSLVGIASEIQGTDYSEVAYESGVSPLQLYSLWLWLIP